MKRVLIVVGLILVLAAGGILAYARFKSPPAPARGDPAIAAAVAVGALLRSETHRLTGEQIAAVLPLLRVLRDTDPNDAEASRALAEEITRVFTPEQRAELARLREEARARREERAAQGGAPGAARRRSGPGFVPGGPGVSGGPGGTPEAAPGVRSRAELRRRLLDRLIQRLEELD